MLSIEQFHEFISEDLPNEYYKLIPKSCPHCKSPIIINYNRTIMKCSNNTCPEHMAHRASNMLAIMGIKGIGASKAFSMIVQNKLKTHMDILSLTEKQMPKEFSEEHKRKLYLSLQNGRNQSLGSILNLFEIDGIGEQTANKITVGYSSFVELFNDNPDISSLRKHILKSLKQHDSTEKILRMTFHMFMSKEDLIRIEKYFNITKLSSNLYKVCMTGEISSVYSDICAFKPRKNLVDLLNKKYEGIISFIDVGKSISDCDVLLTDSKRQTTKYKLAKSLGREVMQFSEFVEYLEHQHGQGNEEIIIFRRN